jgi:hypothetical protein
MTPKGSVFYHFPTKDEIIIAPSTSMSRKPLEIRQDLPIAEVAAGLVNGWEGALLRMKLNGSPKPLESFIETIPADRR